ERTADRLAQRGRVAVGVVLQVLTDGVIGGDRLRARPERGFVRRELEHAGDAGCLALARNVGIDREHAGTRLRTLQGGHFTLRGLTGRWGAAARLRRRPYSGVRGFRRGPWRARRRRPWSACRSLDRCCHLPAPI